MKKAALFLIFFQIVVIGYLGVRTYNKIKASKALGVAAINKNNLVFPTDSSYKYYWLLTPGTVLESQRYWDGTLVHYNFNKDGLNDRYNYDTQKPKDTFRIITLGDSFTFGHFVDTKDNWTEKIEELLNSQKICTNFKKVEVINLGMWGFDIPYLIKRYKDIGAKYNQDLVIWFESESGFTRDNELMQPVIQSCQGQNSSSDSGKILTKNEYYDCWGKAKAEVDKIATPEQIQEKMQNLLKTFLSEKGPTPFLFAGFSKFNSEQKRLITERSEMGENVHTMLSVSDIYSQDAAFPGDGHPTIKGHSIIAKDIFNYLVANKKLFFGCE